MAASTGSPASRRLTKLTPLTTRPSFTSRQGMTRTLNISVRSRRADELQRLRGIEPSIVQRAARNGAFELSRRRRQECAHIVQRGEPAGSDDRNGDGVGETQRGVEVEAFEHAVAGNVGVDDGGDPRVLEASGDVERRETRGLRPAFDRDASLARIKPDRDMARIGPRGTPDQHRVAHRRGADDDPGNALGEPAFKRGAVPDAAAELYGDCHRGENALDRCRVDRLSRKGAIEIDDVEILEALRLERARLRRRVAVEDGG